MQVQDTGVLSEHFFVLASVYKRLQNAACSSCGFCTTYLMKCLLTQMFNDHEIRAREVLVFPIFERMYV
jgi:xanthine dehydrogenase iron-sulfur cluster and FAD-binding subunit A